MKKIAIVGLSALLSACVSSDYVTDVSSESYREDYQAPKVVEPVVTQEGVSEGITETNVQPTVVKMSPKPEKQVVKMTPSKKPTVAITPPTEKQKSASARFGYTIQVVAVGSQAKVEQFARKLPQNEQPIWENYKVVNGTKWYTVLYGDYATPADAKAAIGSLPQDFQSLKPFVKSIDTIKNSDYPSLNKLN
ncbi:SPOR domain-containing protein [Vibrio hepatarius]|jgi:septal ring-binding cell division protein DamX|uniref:Cytochrome C biogenesis protein CcdA n=1 Tax=Vibrio hepatarius TaxID=171383 RepID=A0A0M0I513_9VIBR|nr:SPOR domain-containing protein [Vibrio hepatarius]KOO09400.1 cytochrome C biogenesis protein CcdA [Vibrio hepatarius]NOI13789.1 SPOR domain-containing protein [Vibrio hepatarius]